MKELKGDIWDYHNKGHWIVITTNGIVKGNGEAVMGAGVALETKLRFPDLPAMLGGHIRARSGALFPEVFEHLRIIALPTKYDWRQKADTNLIEEGIKRLANTAATLTSLPIYMVRPGCNNGGLDWEDVRPILEKYLDDRFIVIERR